MLGAMRNVGKAYDEWGNRGDFYNFDAVFSGGIVSKVLRKLKAPTQGNLNLLWNTGLNGYLREDPKGYFVMRYLYSRLYTERF